MRTDGQTDMTNGTVAFHHFANAPKKDNELKIRKKKSSPVTGLEWPRGFREVKVPRFHDNGTGWWLGCQPYAPAAFAPGKYTWYSFLFEAESTPGP